MAIRRKRPARESARDGRNAKYSARPFDIRSGNAMMYYPESNVLVSKAVDPMSKTPAFKHVAITVQLEDNT
jgi:hypothetical protein